MCVAGNVVIVGGSDVCCCVPWYMCDVSPAILTPFGCCLSKQASNNKNKGTGRFRISEESHELEDPEYLWKIQNILFSVFSPFLSPNETVPILVSLNRFSLSLNRLCLFCPG